MSNIFILTAKLAAESGWNNMYIGKVDVTDLDVSYGISDGAPTLTIRNLSGSVYFINVDVLQELHFTRAGA